MDAAALLKAQGWRGTGHSLHHKDDGIGLSKPLLISRKDNTLGIGKKSHATSDQWWLNAFDEQLKGLEVTKKGVVQTATNTKLDLVAPGTGKYSGLYQSFVRGGMLEGTVTPTSTESTDTTPTPESADRKETKEDRRARREAKKLKRAEKTARETKKSTGKAGAAVKDDLRQTKRSASKMDGKSSETKEERRARKEAKRKRREAKEKKRESKG